MTSLSILGGQLLLFTLLLCLICTVLIMLRIKFISIQFNSIVADVELCVGNHADKKEFTGTSRKVYVKTAEMDKSI